LARSKFEALSSTVRKDLPADEEWRGITYLAFELPEATGTFQARAKCISETVKQANLPHLKAVTQTRLNDETNLKAKLKQVIALGREGLMLHKADAPYLTGRSDVLLKLKVRHEAEAKVAGRTLWRGKYKGKPGPLEVVTPEGIHFKLGTRFSDAQRKARQKLAAW
jgi:DNA ligase-1